MTRHPNTPKEDMDIDYGPDTPEDAAKDIANRVCQDYVHKGLTRAELLLILLAVCIAVLALLTLESLRHLPTSLTWGLVIIIGADLGWRLRTGLTGRRARRAERDQCSTKQELIQHHLDVLEQERIRLMGKRTMSGRMRNSRWWRDQLLLVLCSAASTISLTVLTDSAVTAVAFVGAVYITTRTVSQRLDQLGLHMIAVAKFAHLDTSRDSPEL